MNNDEAKFILSAYRPDGADATDPRFTEAIAQSERDPELAEWFQQERRFDAAVSAAVAAIALPAGLRARILAGAEVSRPHTSSTARTLLALAAVLLLCAALAGVWLKRGSGLDRWQRDALAIIPQLGTETLGFDLEDDDPAALRRYLAAKNSPAPASMPAALSSMASLGCKTIASHGNAVSIMCFKMGTGGYIHLVVTEEKGLAHPPPAQPRFRQEDGWETASWSAQGHSHMLATKASAEKLRAVLSQSALVRLEPVSEVETARQLASISLSRARTSR